MDNFTLNESIKHNRLNVCPLHGTNFTYNDCKLCVNLHAYDTYGVPMCTLASNIWSGLIARRTSME